MKKVITKYHHSFKDLEDLTIIVNEESKQIKIKYFHQKWRTKVEAVHFYERVVEQLKNFKP